MSWDEEYATRAYATNAQLPYSAATTYLGEFRDGDDDNDRHYPGRRDDDGEADYDSADPPGLLSMRGAQIVNDDGSGVGHGGHFTPAVRSVSPKASEELSRRVSVNVVSGESDRARGFRLYDGALFTVKNVASEEMFLERMKLAYAAFDRYVAPNMNVKLDQLARYVVVAVKNCLTRYFTASSLQRTNRPFVTRTVYRDCDVMFCTVSDMVRAFLYTRGDDELDESVLWWNGQDVPAPSVGVGEDLPSDEPEEYRVCRLLWQKASALAKTRVLDGSGTTFAELRDPHNPDHVWNDASAPADAGGPEALLIVLADVTAITDFLCYAFYMTPVDLSRRYGVSLGCLRPERGLDSWTGAAAASCCEQRSRRGRKDVVREALRSFIERDAESRRAKRKQAENDGSDSGPTPSGGYDRASSLERRNNDLVRSLVLLLFDKCLTAVLDNGFDNLNKRRRYGPTAKEIGGATIHTGILDTVGDVSVKFGEGTYIRKGGLEDGSDPVDSTVADGRQVKRPRLQFNLPLDSLSAQIVNDGDTTKPAAVPSNRGGTTL